MQKYAIVVESGADVPQEFVERHNIFVVPMYVTLGDDTYEDGTISKAKLFSYFKRTKKMPTTSGCSPAGFSEVFDKIHSQNPEAQIIHLAYSAVTTVSYQSALIAAEGRDYVHHFDTKTVSLGQALVAISVADYIEANPGIKLDELKPFITKAIERSRLTFLPSDLNYLRAGGRLSNASYVGAQLLKVKPCIELIEGRLVATKMYRGSILQAALKLLKDFASKASYDNRYLYLLSTSEFDSQTTEAIEAFSEKVGLKFAGWLQPGCVVSSHGGPGAFGIAALLSE